MATFTTTSDQAGQFAATRGQDCLAYSDEHPGMKLSGFSINADGDVKGEVTEEDGVWKKIVRIPNAASADLVTTPSRDGRFLKLLESAKEPNLLDKLKQMREAIEVGGDFPLHKTLRRMVEEAITDATQTEEKGGNMFPPAAPAKPGVAPGAPVAPVAPAAPIAQPDDSKLKSDAYAHMAEKMQAEGNATLAETYRKMAEGALTTKATESEDESEAKKKKASENEDEDESEAKKKTSEGEDEDESETKKTTESLRKELHSLKVQNKLKESGLPEVYHKSVLRESAGRTLAEVDEIIDSRIKEQEHILRESGGQAPYFGPTPTGNSASTVQAAFAARGL
jgi:hypothetical protein